MTTKRSTSSPGFREIWETQLAAEVINVKVQKAYWHLDTNCRVLRVCYSNLKRRAVIEKWSFRGWEPQKAWEQDMPKELPPENIKDEALELLCNYTLLLGTDMQKESAYELAESLERKKNEDLD